MSNRFYSWILLSGVIICLFPALSHAQRQMEKLDREVLAVKVNAGVFVSWRVLGPEWKGVSYNLYSGTTRLNSKPITGATNYLDESGTLSSTYYVKTIIDGIEQEADDTASVWGKSYFDIPVREIPGNYELNDASVGDLDGDGDYEIVVKRLPPDFSVEPEYTPLLEAYHLDGTYMWTIDLGPNRLNMTQINFVVYDLDGDGSAEVATKTSEGTVDGTGMIIGDVDGDGITNYRPTAVEDDIINGPEFLSIYDGLTGKEVARTNYISRDPLSQWGLPSHNLTQLAHRADNVMMAIIYMDGKKPTLVICRGIYHRIKMAALNYRKGSLTEMWRFDSEEWPPEYAGQGNHNLSVADVDNDGKDEIIYGSMTIDDDGNGLYSTGLGHGDAMHVTDMDPDRPGLEVWQAHEQSPVWGGTYRDAGTGEILIQYIGNRDMGRACTGDITAEYRGMEMWGATECPIYNCNGVTLGPTTVPVNFMIWWDGDLLREFLDHNWLGDEAGVGIGTISKYNGTGAVNLLTANSTYSTNYTKGNPCLQADILGDWREEVIWRTTDNKYLRIYTTIMPTEYRIYTLMHDPQYRIAIAWQNNAYNQPPHPGFYLGDGMDSVPPPPMTDAKLVWNNGINWDLNSSNNWLQHDTLTWFNNGDDVLFDISGENGNPIMINDTLYPSAVTVYSPIDYTFSGPGSLSGFMELLKAGSGTLTINTDNDFTGYTAVWNGSLFVNGSLMNSPVNVKRFAKIGGRGTFGNGITIENRGSMIVGNENAADTLRISGHLTLQGNVTGYFDLSDDTTGTLKANDIISINGNLNITGKNTIHITPLDGHLQPGSYTLITYSAIFSGSTGDIEITGIPGVPYVLEDTGSSIVLHIKSVRAPSKVVWTGEPAADWDLANNINWLNNGIPDWFVGNDTVLFDDTGSPNTTINLIGTLPVSEMLVNASVDYAFTGSGRVSGNGRLIKTGTGKLTLSNQNDYTGATIINNGTLEIPGFENAGYPSPIGASTADPSNLILNGGTLNITGPESATDRSITLGDGGGTIYLSSLNSNPGINGQLTGNGKLIKTGYGTLILNSANTYKGGTLLKRGMIKLGSEDANTGGLGSGPVTIEYGTLTMLDNQSSYTNNCSWDMVIPEDALAWLNLDSRSSLTGSLTGSGTLNLYTPFIRSELFGDWSGFSGKINVSTDSDGGTFLVGNSEGFPDASVSLGNNVTAIYRQTSNVTVKIGELTGTSSSRLGAGGEGSSVITWKIGSKNTNAIFNGVICNDQFKNSGATAAIIKTGTGAWTLTNDNTYTGSTTLEAGKLLINNTSGSGTGTGAVTVKNGAILGGTGAVDGEVTIESGGILAPGSNSIGTFVVNNNLFLMPECFFIVEVNTVEKLSDLLTVTGQVNLGGYLYIINVGPVSFTAGDSIKILEAQNCSGSFDRIIPLTPENGLIWDTTGFAGNRVIRVGSATGLNDPGETDHSFGIYPNPAGDHLYVDFPEILDNVKITLENINGQTVFKSEENNTSCLEVDLSPFVQGIYVLKLKTDDCLFVRKVIKE